MVNAQNWLDSLTIANPKTTLKKILNTVTDGTTEVLNPQGTGKLSGSLKIEGYKALEEIELDLNVITEVEIIDCPNLQKIDFNDNGDIKKLNLEKVNTSGKNDITIVKISGNGGGFDELNLKNCSKLGELTINDLGEIKSIKGVKDFDNPITTVNMDGSTGLHLTTTDELERLESVEKVVEQILGGSGSLPIKPDGTLDTAKLKEDVNKKGAENSAELSAIKNELGLGVSATKDEIIAEIKRLKDIGSSSDYISKASLMSDAKNSLTGLGFSETDINKNLVAAASARDVEISRNKLVSDRFNELQSKLHNDHYLNIGLGTLSVGILVILTWMILKDRKLLPGQEDEVVKE